MPTAPLPQRALRGHRPPRPTPRAATSPAHLAHLAARLTPRDRWLARMLHEHRVLTTHQVAQLAWPSERAANLRLLRLYTWRVLDRFQPFTPVGTAPLHYVLDTAGALVLAREDGLDPAQLGYRHTRAIGIAHSLRLAHTLGVNTFFTTLIAHARRTEDDGRLTAWWPETRCARHFGDLVRPDAYGRWTRTGRHSDLEWFLEYDTGTEPLPRLTAKLSDYQHLAQATGIRTPTLFVFPTLRREQAARHALAPALSTAPTPLPVATTAHDIPLSDDATDPVAARWLPVAPDHAEQRLPLAGLPTAWPDLPPPGPTGSGALPGTLQPPAPAPPVPYRK
ncbi:replication-relaxation family protein [Streptomyces monomycini]|uniref:replication-relaxation family protein n=1 Tax=Streptomyces monomycini TaxID=371720 RepID=UPI001EECE8D7|nr:replication-relaxation family protein [Streptomyces monomycini]